MSWIRRDSWFMYLLPYIVVSLLIISYVKIGDHFGERKPKRLFQKIFYTKQYWQEEIAMMERQKQYIEDSLAAHDVELTIIKSTMKLEVEKSILYAKSLGMDAYQAKMSAEKEINNEIRENILVKQNSQKELAKITNQLESAKRELWKCQ